MGQLLVVFVIEKGLIFLKVKFLEDQFGRIVLQPITEEYIDRVMGLFADGPDLLAIWEKEHREEGKRDK